MKNYVIQKSVLFDNSVPCINCFNKQTNIVHMKKITKVSKKFDKPQSHNGISSLI